MDKVCHFEVPYSDKNRAADFYRNVFGWQIQDVPGMAYSMAVTTPVNERMQPQEAGGINGGMYERSDEGGSATPVIVMQVDSCEQRVKDVESAGGSVVVPPRPVGQMGIYAQVKDTEDNVVGLWQPLGPH